MFEKIVTDGVGLVSLAVTTSDGENNKVTTTLSVTVGSGFFVSEKRRSKASQTLINTGFLRQKILSVNSSKI